MAAAATAAALAWLAAACLLLAAQVACEYGMVHVVSEMGGPKGKDYCILYNPQWAHLPHDLSKALRDWTTSMLCSASDLPAKGFSNQIPLVTRGNCTFYDKVRLAQGSGAHGLLIVSKETLVPPGGNKTQYEEIDIPVALLSYKDMLDIFKNFGRSVRAALYAPHEPMLDYNMVIIFIMAVGTVALGGYWAGSRDVKKYMKHKRDDEPEKQEDEAVDVTPVMTCIFVVMCCSMLVLLYYFYDHLVYVIIGIFCLASSTGLYSCLSPLVQRLPFGKCRVCNSSLPYFHKCPQVRMLLLALFCVGVSVVWAIFRNEDQWAWVLQDALGIAFCLYMLKTIRLPTFKACTLLLMVLFIYDIFFVFITPFLTKSGNSIMVEVATGPADSATREKLPMVLKVPRLSASPLALCDRPFSLLGFGDILVPGLLVAYCHRFDIQVQSSRVYFVACTIAYGIGLLVTFMALALMQRGQPALLYLVPCTLITSGALALWRGELGMFWTGSGFAKDLPQPPWVPASAEGPQPLKDSEVVFSQQPPGEAQVKPTLPEEQPPELADPKDEAGVSTQEPVSPASHTLEPPGLPRHLSLGGQCSLSPLPSLQDWTCHSPNLVLWSGRCSHLKPSHTWTPGPAPSSCGCRNPGTAKVPVPRSQPHIFLFGVSVEPQKGRKHHLCPLMAAHLPHLVLTPCCCFLQAPLEMLGPGPEGRGLPQRPWLSFCSAAGPDAESQAWRCGLRPSAQLAWDLDPPLDRLGSWLRATSKAGGTWTGALGLSLTPVPSSAWECSLCSVQPLHVLINSHDFPKCQWCHLLDCPSWRQDGHQAGWPVPWGPQARHPGALNGRLCPLCRLRCLGTEELGLSFPHHGHLHVLDCILAHDSLASSCSTSKASIHEELLERGGMFWNWHFVFYL